MVVCVSSLYRVGLKWGRQHIHWSRYCCLVCDVVDRRVRFTETSRANTRTHVVLHVSCLGSVGFVFQPWRYDGDAEQENNAFGEPIEVLVPDCSSWDLSRSRLECREFSQRNRDEYHRGYRGCSRRQELHYRVLSSHPLGAS